MPRGKKAQETSKKRTKKMAEEEEDEDEIIEEDEAPVKKNTRKQSTKNSKSKGKKKAESEEEDELSDLQVDDDDDTNESGENEEVVMSHKREKQPIKKIDPKTAIGDLTVEDVLNYLVQKGIDNLNPTLKFGALELKGQLTGRRRRHPQTYGSKRNNYGPNPRFNNNRGNQYSQGSNRGGLNGLNGRNMQQSSSRNPQRQSYPQEDLYNDE